MLKRLSAPVCRRAPQAGFTLLELLVVLGVLAILAAAATPRLVEHVRLQAAQTTAQDLAGLADAARAFYVAQFPNVRWPVDFAELGAAGYLPTGFTATNPFGQPYTLAVAGTRLQLGTTVPANLGRAVARLLPLASEAAGTVTTEYPVPGQASDFTQVQLEIDQLTTRVDQLRTDVDQLRTDLDALTARVNVADWSGRIVLTDGECPTGWTRFARADGQYLVASPTAGITGGQTTYSHNHSASLSGNASGTITGVTGPPDRGDAVQRGGGSQWIFFAPPDHLHDFSADVDLPVTVSGTTDTVNQDIVPPFYTAVLCQRDAIP